MRQAAHKSGSTTDGNSDQALRVRAIPLERLITFAFFESSEHSPPMRSSAEVPQPTHYDILHLQPNRRSFDPSEVKTAYHRALLSHHPDKHSSGTSRALHTAGPTPSCVFSVDQITKAYKVLANAEEKAEYDEVLRKLNMSLNVAPKQARHTGVESYDLEEFSYADDTESWHRSCRCGYTNAYTLTGPDLENESEQGEVYVQCAGCSLLISVLFDTV
jgi:diphthamide biosynthesis protein 4